MNRRSRELDAMDLKRLKPPYRVQYSTYRTLSDPTIDWKTVRVTDAIGNPVSALQAAEMMGNPHVSPLMMAFGIGAVGVVIGLLIGKLVKQ